MWTFYMPTKITFGVGSTATLTEMAEIASRRIVVVTDRVLMQLPAVKTMIERLKPAAVFYDIRPNPTVVNVDTLAGLLRSENVEVVVAVGGGSALDTSKAAASLARTEEPSIRAFHSGGKTFSAGGIPVVTIPTTAGTGAEVTPIAVLDDEEKNFKGPMASPSFYPVHAVVNPELTLSVPLGVTASTALDALSHAIEGYWSKNHQPICDTIAKEAARTIFVHLPKVFDDLACLEAREALSYAALTAGIAFQMSKNAIMHACSFPLSNRLHMPHGTACAFTMEAAIRWNAPAMDGRMEEFARYCGFNSIEEMTKAISELKRRGGLPRTLREAGIEKPMLDLLIKESFHPLMNNNPKPVTEEDLRRIYAELDVDG